MPGMKDYVRVEQPGQKAKKMTKHILALKLKEAYALYVKEQPDVRLSFSSFAHLR